MLTITLPQELETALNEQASTTGIAPELLVLNVLREKFVVSMSSFVPQDDWEQSLLSAGSDCGVSLPHIALSSEGLYE